MALGKRINTLNLKKTSPARGMFDGIWSESGGFFGAKDRKRNTDQAESSMNQAIDDFGNLDTSNLAADFKNPYADAKNVYAGATNAFAGAKNAFAGAQNQFANVQNQFGNLENTAEDLTVNTQQAEFEKQQFQQSQANMLGSLAGGAGSSGVAGLAQALSNQNMRQAQQSSASIGQQESQNQAMAAQQAGSNQMASAQGAQSAEMARAQGAANQQSQIMGGAADQQSQIMGGAAQQQAMILGGASDQQGMIMGGAADLQGMQFQGATDARGLEYDKQQAMVAARSGQYASARQEQQDAGSGFGQVLGAGLKAKIAFVCIPKGEKIDIPDGLRKNIEDIRPGDIVIGYSGEPVKVLQKHEYLENPNVKRFYEIEFKDGVKINVCDKHKVKGIAAEDILEDVVGKNIYDGVNFSYDLLTEDSGYKINGISVNSMIEELAELTTKLKNK